MKRYSVPFVLLAWLMFAGLASAETTINVCSYGGTYNEGLAETIGKPFTAETGINVVFTTRPSSAKMEAQVQTGNIEWDVVDCESRMYARGVKSGLFEKLDLSMIDTADFAPGSVTPYAVGLVSFSLTISYNSDKWPAGEGPQSMVDFWDVAKFPGPRTMPYSAFRSLEAALLADGVPKEQVYPIDLERALAKLTELRPHIRVFWKSGGHSQTIMREKEADIGLVPGGRMIQLADQGIPVTWEWNDQIIVQDFWTILKGSPNKEAAMQFIAFASRPEIIATFAEWTNYGPANQRAYDFISTDKAVLMPTYPANFSRGLVTDADWYAEHEAEVERRWEAWKMK